MEGGRISKKMCILIQSYGSVGKAKGTPGRGQYRYSALDIDCGEPPVLLEMTQLTETRRVLQARRGLCAAGNPPDFPLALQTAGTPGHLWGGLMKLPPPLPGPDCWVWSWCLHHWGSGDISSAGRHWELSWEVWKPRDRHEEEGEGTGQERQWRGRDKINSLSNYQGLSDPEDPRGLSLETSH